MVRLGHVRPPAGARAILCGVEFARLDRKLAPHPSMARAPNLPGGTRPMRMRRLRAVYAMKCILLAMSEPEFRGGQPVVVEILRGDASRASFKARIAGTDRKRLILNVLPGETLPAFARGDRVRISVIERAQVRVFEASGIRVVEGGRNLLSVGLLSDGKRVQRRFDFRLPLRLSAAIEVLGDPTDSSGRRCVSVTEDLSAAGLRLRCPIPVEVGARLELVIDLPDEGKVSIAGTVVRTGDVDSETGLTPLSVHFEDVPLRTQARLVRFLRRQERELRRKQLAD